MKKITGLFFFLFTVFSVFAQVTIKPRVDRLDEYSLRIDKIELTENNTIVYCTHTAPFLYEKGGWVNIRPGTYLRDRATRKKYKLISAIGIPLSPSKHFYSAQGQTLSFRLVFSRLPSNCSLIDLVECENNKECFNFYGVHLLTSSYTKNRQESNTGDSGSFRVDFDHYSVYDAREDSWSDWAEGNMTVVFNINDNGDVKLYLANGEQRVLRRFGKIDRDETPNGKSYQIFTVLEVDGTELLIQLFDYGDMKLIYQDGSCIQMSDFSRSGN